MALSCIRYHGASIAVLLFFSAPLCGQGGRAELFGYVRDPAALPVPGAAVALVQEDTGARREALTSTGGAYHFAGLPPGTYDLTFEKYGFRILRRPGLVLRLGDRVESDAALELGDIGQTVEVRASAPLLQNGSGAAGIVVGQKQAATLPLDGRNFVPLIALAPGVMLPPGQVLPRINGSRPRVSEYLYDGVSVLQPEPGQVAFYPVIDSIEEFRVQTNSYSAEYGRSNGGVIQVSSKSGANEVHGSVFEYFRNEALNARNLFAAPGAKPPFRRNIYGATAGGPVRRNRTFFFGDWQGTRLRTGVTRFSTVPTAAQRQGVFGTAIGDPLSRRPFPGNAIPASRFDPAASRLLTRYPQPINPGAANNYARRGSDTERADQFDFRVDHSLGDRRRVFARYSYLRDDARPMTPLPDGSGALSSGNIANTLTRGDGLVVEDAWTVSPSSLNQFRLGWSRRGFARNELATGQPLSALTGVPHIPAAVFTDVLPVFEIAGYQQLGPSGSANSRFTTSVTELLDDFALVRGPHSLKFGADLRWERLNALAPPNPTGDFQFNSVLTGNSLASFLLGQAQNFSLDSQQDVLRPRAHIAEFFAQDDWKATGRLTLNLGVRYTLNFPSTVAEDRGAIFNLDTQRLDLLGRNGLPRTARDLEKHNFGPRVGLAFAPSASFAVRAGYGLVWIEQAGITTPFTTPLFPFIQTLSQRSLDNLTPAFVLSEGPAVSAAAPGPDSGLGQGVLAVQRDNGSGYAQQWNLTVQKTFGNRWSVEAGYAGSKLTRLGVPDTNLNQLRVEQLGLRTELVRQVANPFYGAIPASSSLGGPTIPEQQLLRPYPKFGAVSLYRNNVGHSTYHSLQTRLERRLARGLTATAAYTFSKLIDDAGAVFDSAALTGPVLNYQAADSFNRRLEKDESTGSIPQVFTAGFVYDLPFGHGWQIAGIVKAQSGMPLAVTQATNYNAAFGFGIQRPNRVTDPNLPLGARTTARYFNTAAFTTAPEFTIGNSSRNPVRGPGYDAADLLIGKLFAVTERIGAELRLEAFNVTNTPPLGQPNGSYGSPAFGAIAAAGDPRVFELVMRLKW